MVRELAEYERSAHEVRATEEMLADLLFGANTPSGAPAAYCHVALALGRPTAHRWPAWPCGSSTPRRGTGRHGIYLEDLYVRPAFRGLGLGQSLMAELARICVDRGYARLEWWVLDWNSPPSTSTARWGPGRWTSGPCTASPASRSTTWHSAQRRREATPAMSRPPSVAAIG